MTSNPPIHAFPYNSASISSLFVILAKYFELYG